MSYPPGSGPHGQQPQDAPGRGQHPGGHPQPGWNPQQSGWEKPQSAWDQQQAAGQPQATQQQSAWGQQQVVGQQQSAWGEQQASGQAQATQQQTAWGQPQVAQQQVAWGEQQAGGQQQPGWGEQQAAGQQQSAWGEQQVAGQQQPAWGQQQAMGQQQPAWGQQQPVWDQQQPSAWGQQAGWEQQPPQVWAQQPGYPGGYSPQPPKKNTGLIVGIVLGVVAVLVIGAGIVVLATRHKSDNHASASVATPSLVPATTSSTAAGRPTTTPSSSASSRFSYQEQAKDWNFKLGDVSLHADWVEGVDHPTCADIEKNGKLTSLGCQYAAEMVYRAEDGGLMLTQFVMGMVDADKASAASGQYSDSDLNLRPGSYIDHFAVGKWKDDAQGQYLVLTMVTATDAVDEDTAKKYLRYLHGDMLGALTFR